MSSKSCPICIGFWYETEKVNYLCSEHSKSVSWYVTECKKCGLYCFSTMIGLCISCAELYKQTNSE